jgi:hypothetical protein
VLIVANQLLGEDEPAYFVQMVFVFERHVDEVGPLGDALDTFEQGADLPGLVVNSEAHLGRSIEQKQ